MVDGAMVVELFAERGIDHAFVAHEHAGAVGIGDDKGPDGFSTDICNMEGLDAPATLNERKNGFLRRGLFVSAVLGLPANICFVNLNNFVLAAQSARGLMAYVVHSFTNAVRHEPCGAVRAEAEHAPKLMRAHALLGRAEKARCEQPLMQRNMRAFVNGADC